MSSKGLVETLISAVVEHPESVTVNEEVDGSVRTYLVRVASDDVGKVIGKSGRVVSAIRSVVSAAASKNREKAFVKILTEDE